MGDKTYVVRIRRYKPGDTDILLEMTHEVGWKTSLVDCQASLEVDSNGLLVAEDDTGVILGFIGAFKMSPKLTYIDDFIVRKDLRGEGIGRKLWSTMLDATNDDVLVLDCSTNMRDWYKERGFRFEAYNFRFCNVVLTSKPQVASNSAYEFIPLSDDEMPALVAYDKTIYPYSRENVLRAWSRGTDTYTAVAMYGKAVVGFSNFHWKSEKECNIRALYADNETVAEELLGKLLQNIPIGSKIAFNVFSDKPMPDCFSNFHSSNTVHRLYTEEVLGITDYKIFFNAAHMV